MTTQDQTPAATDSRWDSDIKLLDEAMHLVLTNDFEGAGIKFKQGADAGAPLKTSGAKDVRSVFALLYALLSAALGLANFSKHQLKECYQRLLAADKLAQQSSDWVGKKIMRGLGLVVIGALELVQRSYVKGILNISRSTKYMKTLRKEGLDYPGPEKIIVRSAALYFLGAMSILYSFLPPSSLKIAKWVSGFSGDRQKGLEMLRTCFQEQGLCAPWAAMSYIIFQVDTKTFVGETMNDDEKEKVVEMMQWAKNKYPSSVIFANCEISLASIMHEQHRALEIAVESEKHHVLPALSLALKHQQAVVQWSLLDFAAAGQAKLDGIHIILESKQGSLGLFNSAISLISYLQVYSDSPSEETWSKLQEVVSLAQQFADAKTKKKKKLGRQDQIAMSIFKTFCVKKTSGADSGKKSKSKEIKFELEKSCLKRDWVLLHIAELMVILVRCTYFMPNEYLVKFREMLLNEEKIRSQDSEIEITLLEELKLKLILTDLSFHERDFTKACQIAREGLALEKEVAAFLKTTRDSKESKRLLGDLNGRFAVLSFYLAKMHQENGDLEQAKIQMKNVRGYKNHRFSDMLFLKTIVLSQAIGEEYENDYEVLKVPASKKAVVTIDLANDTNRQFLEESKKLEFVWLLEARTIGFEIVLVNGEEEKSLWKVERNATESEKMHQGELEYLPQQGELRLVFDNSFSYMRAKSVKLKLTPNVEVSGL